MSQNVSEYLLERLHDWGVRRIYGYPGDGINAVLGALDEYEDKVRFIQTRHEELAAFMECDTLLMVGSGFPYSEFLPKEGQARGVQIDIKPRMLSLRYPMEVPLHGDAKLTLRALLPLLERKTDSSWREKVESGVAEWASTWRPTRRSFCHTSTKAVSGLGATTPSPTSASGLGARA